MRSSLVPPRLARATDVDDVVSNVERIIEWSKAAESHLGYFAAVYKRVTLAIRDDIDRGGFQDGRRVAQLDVAFAQRYFDALNAHFHPGEYHGLTLPWEVPFVGDHDGEAVILQHLMSAFTAHISFDLGMACFAVAADSLDTLEPDFNRVNALLCSQMPGMVEEMQRLSPGLVWMRRLIPDELGFFDRVLTNMRQGAWLFAYSMAAHRDAAEQKRVHQAAWTAALASWYLHPPSRFRLFPVLARAVAKRESTDVAENIAALEQRSNTPDELHHRYL
ncbi:DUF5995 family protein [Mycobacterium palustre]|uniref:Uncharacterized protein n=1 Tax=Mycobacterium palustre TaxID=153971 RepID=A0A1X1ZKS8_9MYCO|nr:DUF5995 family protein [Mycobacterium palustre]MCV7099310.1 hypothetical protein [Mycobacterium palustre]ORW23946.1 hypothetical protein AWC19_10405 [Mycobacterium palustre]